MFNVSFSFLVNFNIRGNCLRMTHPLCEYGQVTGRGSCYCHGFRLVSSYMTLSKNEVGTFAWLQLYTCLPHCKSWFSLKK